MVIKPVKQPQEKTSTEQSHATVALPEAAISRHLWLRRRLIPLAVFVLLMLACSAADLVQRQREQAIPSPTPTPVALLATFTPTPVPAQTLIIVTPPSDNEPGVIIIPPGMDPSSVIPDLPTATPTLSPTSELPNGQPQSPLLTPGQPGEIPSEPTQTLIELVPTDTPVPTIPPTPTETPTPFVLVESGMVALRTGPGLQYPLLAQLGPDIPVAIVGRTEDGAWLEICCISGQTAWVVSTHVSVHNDISSVQIGMAEPPPTPTPTPLPTETPTPLPTPTATLAPFERAIGPQFFPTSNEYITIWAKIYIGVSPFEQPLPDYYLTVLFEGFERPNALGKVASRDVFEFSAPPGSGNRVQYNYKYEYRPPDPSTVSSEATRLQLIGSGTWTVYVSDGAGTRLSDEVTFTTEPSNPNREIYIGWVRVR